MKNKKTDVVLPEATEINAVKSKQTSIKANSNDVDNYRYDHSLAAACLNTAASDPYSKKIFLGVEFDFLKDALKDKISVVAAGNTVPMEAMLIGQAEALQNIFVSLCRKASSQEDIGKYQTFLTLALKAQSQSRATIQALTELKYPKQATFVKQANISHGHQQVNNETSTRTRVKKTKTKSNELLEADNGEWLDTRTQGKTSGADKAVETLAT